MTLRILYVAHFVSLLTGCSYLPSAHAQPPVFSDDHSIDAIVGAGNQETRSVYFGVERRI